MGFMYTNGLQRRMGPVTLNMQQQGPVPQGALQAPPPPAEAPPVQATPPQPPPVPQQYPAASLVAAAPQRQGYSASVAAALARNGQGPIMTTPSMPHAPMQPAPYNHPAPLVLPPPATGALTPTPDPTQTPGMIAARAAGTPEGGLPNSVSALLWGGIDPFGMGKKNSSAIQDIGRAMSLGRPITDAQWAQANYGPGGK